MLSLDAGSATHRVPQATVDPRPVTLPIIHSIAVELIEHSTADALTEREIEVLRLIAAGIANKEIAARLSIKEETVKGRVKNILMKLGANDRTHAAMIGLKRGIIEL